jgi:hypothetical protein
VQGCEKITQSWNVQFKFAPPRTRVTAACLVVALYSSVHSSVAQSFYTWITLFIVEESWRHTNPILHIVGGGKREREMVYGIDWPRQLLINRPQPKNVLFDGHKNPSLFFMSFVLNIFIVWNKLKFIIFISFNPKFINSCVIIWT